MAKPNEDNSYNSILNTTGLIGLVQLIGISLGIIRTKAIAMILGSSGFGILSLYNGLVDFASSTSQFGAGIGGVKELSREIALENKKAVEELIFVLRFWMIMASSLACLIMVIFASEISQFQFNSLDQVNGIRILSFAVIFGNIYNIQISILNGVRRLKQMAISQVMAGVGGVFVALPIIYFAGKSGIEISILAVSLFNCIISYYYVRKVGYRSLRVNWTTFKYHYRGIMQVGLSFAIPGVIGACLVYVTRLYLKEQFSFEVLGVYQACVVLSTLYIQTILNAMGADFLPRLMEVHTDNALVNRKVNEQMEFGVLVASIGVFATFIFAPILLRIFYSEQFVAGTTILRWQIIAVFLRVLEWPLGFTITAKGKNTLFMKQQSIYLLFELGVIFLLTKVWGMNGLAVSYFVAYSIFFVIRIISVREITGFRFSQLMKSLSITILFFLVGFTLLITTLPSSLGISSSAILLLAYLYWVDRTLKIKMGVNILQIIGSKFGIIKNS
ncbi:MAG: oligosaccharide flippase family protein [Bacteroidales bacterium]|nr:oligosaccharide flippase family protein [Bacteroidales bacterium]